MTVTEVISKKSDVVSKRTKHENLVIQKCFFCKSTNKKKHKKYKYICNKNYESLKTSAFNISRFNLLQSEKK